MDIERGDILICDFGERHDSSIQDGVRPAVVVSNEWANRHSPVITVVPLTCRIHKKRYLPTHVFIHKNMAYGLHRHSMALAEQVTSLDGRNIVSKVGAVNGQILTEITAAVAVQVGMFGWRKAGMQ